MRRVRGLALDVSPLRDSTAYRALWIGQIISNLGTQMRFVAVSWLVFRITGSSLAVGLVGLAELGPLVIFSIVGGALADSSDRRSVMLKAQAGSLLSAVALAVVAFQSRPSLAAIYVLTIVGSVFSSLDRPARTAMIPSLVGPDQLVSAMALRQVVFQTTAIVGPAIAGVMLASVQVGWVYVADAATFVAALAALRWVPSGRLDRATGESGWQAVRDGLRFALGTRLILGIFVIDLVAMIFGMPRALFPALAEDTFGLGASGLGWLYAAPAVGALLGALSSGWVSGIARQGRAVLVAVTVWGACISLAGLSLFSFTLTLWWLAAAGAADVVSAIFRNAMLQEATPDALRGRVSAANLVVVAGGPRLGDIEAGFAAQVTSAPTSVLIGGIACLAGTAIVAARFQQLRRYRLR